MTHRGAKVSRVETLLKISRENKCWLFSLDASRDEMNLRLHDNIEFNDKRPLLRSCPNYRERRAPLAYPHISPPEILDKKTLINIRMIGIKQHYVAPPLENRQHKRKYITVIHAPLGAKPRFVDNRVRPDAFADKTGRGWILLRRPGSDFSDTKSCVTMGIPECWSVLTIAGASRSRFFSRKNSALYSTTPA